MRLKLPVALALSICLAAGPALAHHSGAMFDRNKTTELKGVVKEYQYINPHSWIRLMVPAAGGKQVEWAVEGGSPRLMAGWGITPATVRPGDKVSVRMHPLRDGRRGGAFVDITLPDGRRLTSLSAHPELGKPRF